MTEKPATQTGRLRLALALAMGLAPFLLWLSISLAMRLPVARAADLTVCLEGFPTCGYAAIQDAVDNATPGDVIKVATGTYTDVNTYGGLSQVVYISKTVTIRGGYTTADWLVSDPDAYPTTLDAQGLGRVMVITGAITPTVEGLRITGGDASELGGGYWGEDAGGGVYVYSATATISNCMVYSNTASTTKTGTGGGIALSYSAARLVGNTVRDNSASTSSAGLGGGIYVEYGAAELVGNTVQKNTAGAALSGGGGSGGGVYLSNSPATLDSNIVISNTASVSDQGAEAYGGGVYLYNSAASVSGQSGGYGGGVYLYDSAARLEGNTVQGNIANTGLYSYGAGGGIYLESVAAELVSNTIQGNSASTADWSPGIGGGIYLYSYQPVTLTGNTVVSNTASTAYRGYGGGLSIVYTEATLIGNTVAGNTASTGDDGYGGGIHIAIIEGSGPPVTLERNTVQNNVASTTDNGRGGGMYIEGNTTMLASNTVVSNTATLSSTATGEGGGVWVGYLWDDASLTMTNNLVADNHANTAGSGLYFIGGQMGTTGQLLHNTIADNAAAAAGSGQGVYVGQFTALVFSNTIIAGHASVGITATDSSAIITLAGTLWHDNGLDAGGAGTIISSTNVYGDPAFADPTSWDYHLTADSAAIDAGVNAGVATDFEGEARDTAPDIGFDEVETRCFARPESSGVVYSSATAVALRQAVDAATGGDTVKVAGTCAGVEMRAGVTQTVYISKSLTVRGGYTATNWTVSDPIADPTTLDALDGGHVMYIASGASITLENVSLTGGNATDGGGIYHNGNSLTLNNTNIFGNAASNFGGGVHVNSGAVTLNSGQIFSNTALFRGSGASVGTGSLTINGGQIFSNTALSGGSAVVFVDPGNLTMNGGEIRDNNSGVWIHYGNMLMSGGKISHNAGVGVELSHDNFTMTGGEISHSSSSGVHIHNWDAFFTMTGGSIAYNTATSGAGVSVGYGYANLNGGQIIGNTATGTGATDGGGVYVYQGSATFSETQIISNTAQYGGGVYVRSGSTTLSGGQIISNTATYGGGVYVGFATAAFTQTGTSFITSNSATYGGGVYVSTGSATLDSAQAQVAHNTATEDGGGIYIGSGHVILSEGQIAHNSAGEYGGGVCVGLSGSVFTQTGGAVVSNTSAEDGGGVYVDWGQATWSGGEIRANTASSLGGGVFGNHGNATLSGTQIFDNAASAGGGMCVDESGVTVAGGQIISNTATNGGGVYVLSSTLTTLMDATVSHNSGGGLRVDGGIVKVYTTTLEANDIGIVVEDGLAPSGSLVVHTSVISGNTTAGLRYTSGSSTDIDVTLSGAPSLANVFRNNGPGGMLNVDVTASNTRLPISAFYNDWGVTGVGNIENTLHHQLDDPALARVEYYTLTLVANPTSQVADGVSPVTLTATLTGVLNLPAGEAISFTTSLGTLSAPTGVTNTSDEATVTATSTVAGTAWVSATTAADPQWVWPATATVDWQGSDVSIDKTVSPALAGPGDTVTYLLTFDNKGSVTATGVVISDVVPSALADVSYINTGAALMPTGSISYTWNVADLAPGAGGVITITGVVSTGVTGVFSLCNQAEITMTVADIAPTNNTTPMVCNTIDAEPPTPPTLISPADGTLTNDSTPTLTWSASPILDVAEHPIGFDAAEITGYLVNVNGSVTDVGNSTSYTTAILADGTYSWSVAAYDALSNTSAFAGPWSFTIDTVAPTIVAVAPADGAVDVETTALVEITFSEPINTGTFAFTITPNPGGWSISWSGGGTVATLTHAPFASGTAYAVNVTIAGDQAGNSLAEAPYEWSFATAPHRVYLPLISNFYVVAPDLVVERIIATENDVQVVIKNQGNATAVQNFWVDAYINPDPAPTHVNQPWPDLADHGLVWGVSADLAPGEVLTLTVGGDYYSVIYSDVTWPLATGAEVYAQVDSYNPESTYGNTLEIDEIRGEPYNNIAHVTVPSGGSGTSPATELPVISSCPKTTSQFSRFCPRYF